ncbi:glycosyltransferase [Gymnodinialimonas ulvae]|uniref:glycosyltransferase n=1 Tax=Gymnodinialimonas ulvae TaxID=3126504 RepID=UPI0030EE46FC
MNRLAQRQGVDGATYLNIGHANLSGDVLSVFGGGTACVVMVHDLIPITHPDLVAPTQPANFAGRIGRVRRHASHVIANSRATATALGDHWTGTDRVPPITVAPLGADHFTRVDAARDPLHFVMLGTIEPRKNHGLMIDVWEALATEYPADQMPQLHIIGLPGWRGEALMDRLERHMLRGTAIHLHGGLPDTEMRAHLARANALLFPSITEGYGFPPLEAAMAGATPVCSDLAVFHETLGDCGVYVDNPTAYHWKETIKQLIDDKVRVPDPTDVKVQTWQEHFEIVAESVISQDVRGRS